MDSQVDPTFSVQYKRDGEIGRSALKYCPGRLTFFLHSGSGTDAFHVIDNKKEKVADQSLVADIKTLPPRPPTGVTTTLRLRDHNLYLKFDSSEEMRRFYAFLKDLIASGSNNKTAATISSANVRSSRADTNDSRNDSVPAIHINGISANGLGNDVSKESDDQSDKIDFLAGLSEEDKAENKNPSSKRAPPYPTSNVTRSFGNFLDVKLEPPVRVDKENQHRTPVKNSNQSDAAEKRTPLTPKCEPSSAIPRPRPRPMRRPAALPIFEESWATPPEKRNSTIPSIPYRHGALLPPRKRSAVSIMEPLNDWSKRSKSNDHDGNSVWSSRTSAFSEKPQLKGFANMGNTCYMNSILQALFRLDPFAKELHKCFKYFNDYIPSDWLFFSLPSLLGVKDHENQELKTDLLRNVKKAISSTAKRFMGNAQHDAHEFLAQVLDQLKDEIQRMTEICTTAGVIPQNPIPSNFEFSVIHSMDCRNCHHVSQKEEMFMDLSLDLPLLRRNNEAPLPLQPLLDSFFKNDIYDYKCEKCGEDGTALVSHKFSKLPRILTLHLKRYTFTNAAAGDAKLATKIALPRYLSLHRLCVDNIEKAPLLSESTKKHIVTQSGPSESSSHRTETAEKARRQLFEDQAKPKLSDVEKRPGLSTYFTRAAARGSTMSYVGIDEESALDDVIERSKYETGPPSDYLEETEYDRQVEEALRLSLLETSGCSTDRDASLLADTAQQVTENFMEEELDGEMLQNAEDGHLQHSFRLFGVVNHIGSGTESGHYISDVFDLDTASWRSYNDSQVSEITEESVMQGRQQSAYIFFYVSQAVLDDVKGIGSSSS